MKKLTAPLIVVLLTAILLSVSLPVMAATRYHTIQKGDTLFLIARAYGTTVSSLKISNNLTSDTVYPGQVLLIPEKNSGSTTNASRKYIVQAGDTLWLLSMRFGVSIQSIKTANGLTSDLLYVGQVLTIPTGSSPTPPLDAQDRYSVQPGDSLFLIAQRFGTTINELKQANGLVTDMIYVGQVLVIPKSTASPAPQASLYLYQVKWEDTLHSIAAQLGVSTQSIIDTNMLETTEVESWMALLINQPNSKTTDLMPVSLPKGFSAADYHRLARMTYAEAGAEPYEGQVAVAAVILNRVQSSSFPNTIEGVLKQPYQFEPISNGYYVKAVPSMSAYRAALEAVNGVDPTNGALFFFDPSRTTNQWLLSRQVTYRIGTHVFTL